MKISQGNAEQDIVRTVISQSIGFRIFSALPSEIMDMIFPHIHEKYFSKN
jgi:hypothetical protein